MKILLVEDTQLPAMIASTMLKDAGHVVDLAETGQKALDMASAHSYEIVFMDIGLPDTDGFEVAQKIHEAQPNIKIIGLTAHAVDGDYRKKALWNGFTDIIAKPLNKEYVSKLSGLLNKN